MLGATSVEQSHAIYVESKEIFQKVRKYEFKRVDVKFW